MVDNKHGVVVPDIKSLFGPVVTLMVKWAVAAIPALIVLLVVGAVASSVIAALFGDVLPRGITSWWAR
jgi:hypothetical protein